ncbi:MAG: gfo/Idh/MocA family oxidoreductase, partial [Cyclobacteriaceae bacterium]|nr:gfo/Idh/MocA family oxidoreductase [Cyclobacteriaceae bacterium]
VADIGTHWLDLLQFITGMRVVRVCAALKTFLPNRRRPVGSIETFQAKLAVPQDTEPVAIDTEDQGSVLLEFDTGATGCFSVSQVMAGRKNRLDYEIAGSKGSLAWDSECPNDLWIGKRNEANQVLMRDPSLVDAEVRSIIAYPGGHNEGFGDTSKQLFRDVYAAVAKGQQPAQPSFPTFAEGLRELRLCDAIVESHRKQSWIKV